MRQRRVVASSGLPIVGLVVASTVVAGEHVMQLDLQTRNPQTGKAIVTTEKVDARDLAFAWTTYDPAVGYTPTSGNRQAAPVLEPEGRRGAHLGRWSPLLARGSAAIQPSGV